MAAKAKSGSARTAIIFIDTNVFLNLYRFEKAAELEQMLGRIVANKNLIITNRQIEMEYLKKRQTNLDRAIDVVKKLKVEGLDTPPLLFGTKPVNDLNKAKNAYRKHQGEIVEQLKSILAHPVTDRIYTELRKLFTCDSDLNLTDGNDDAWSQLQKAANKRFRRGFPPRKDRDTSIGDAINWEWIIRCANKNKKADTVLVSQDGDYGLITDDDCFLNDWLRQEFAERVGTDRKIMFTNRLAEGLDWAGIPVTKEEAQEEKEAIKRSSTAAFLPSEMVVPMAAASTDEFGNIVLRGMRPPMTFYGGSSVVQPVYVPEDDNSDPD